MGNLRLPDLERNSLNHKVEKIALLLPDLKAGGAQRVFLNLASEFGKKDIAVDLLLLTYYEDLIDQVPENVNLTILNHRTANNLLTKLLQLTLSGFRLRKYLKEIQPDVIMSSLTGTNIFLLLLVKLMQLPIPVIIREANTVDNINSKFVKLLVKIFYPWANHIVCVSSTIRNGLLSIGISPHKATTINNPVDIEQINLRANEPTNHEWITNGQAPLIVAIGRLSRQKGFDILLQAVSKVRKQINCNLIILGDGPLRPELENLCQQLDIKDNVDLIPFTSNPYSYLKAANLFVISSHWEGFVNVLLEAMALGTSVVATDCESSPREILKDGSIGKLVPVGDIDSMASAILYTLSHPQDSSLLKQRCSDFAIDKVGAKYEELLVKVTMSAT